MENFDHRSILVDSGTIVQSSGGWVVGSTLEESYGGLWNRQDTDLPPRANWLYSNKYGKWSDDDRTLKLDYTTLSSPCKLVKVAGSGHVLDHHSSRMGDYRFASHCCQ